MGINAQEQGDGEFLSRISAAGGKVAVFVHDLDDVDDVDDETEPVSAVSNAVSCAINPKFREGDILEYEDGFDWLKVKIIQDLSDTDNIIYRLQVLKVLRESSFKKKGQLFIHDHARAFGGRRLKRFGDEF